MRANSCVCGEWRGGGGGGREGEGWRGGEVRSKLESSGTQNPTSHKCALVDTHGHLWARHPHPGSAESERPRCVLPLTPAHSQHSRRTSHHVASWPPDIPPIHTCLPSPTACLPSWLPPAILATPYIDYAHAFTHLRIVDVAQPQHHHLDARPLQRGNDLCAGREGDTGPAAEEAEEAKDVAEAEETREHVMEGSTRPCACSLRRHPLAVALRRPHCMRVVPRSPRLVASAVSRPSSILSGSRYSPP